MSPDATRDGSRLRILSFGSVPPEWGGTTRGGVATFHSGLLSALASQADVEVAGLVMPTQGAGRAPFPALAPEAGQDRRQFLREVVGSTSPDVILLHHFANAWGRLLPDVAPDVRRIGIAHSWHVITSSDAAEQQRKAADVQSILSHLDAVVLGSEHCRSEGERLGLRYPRRAETIVYPLDPSFADPIDVERPRRDGVVYLGSLIPRKDPAMVVETAALLPDLQVTLAGEGPEERTLRALIDARGLAGRVRIEPHRQPGQHIGWVRRILSEAQALVLPSRSESFGLVFIEALACGTPIVGFAPTIQEIESRMGTRIGQAVDDPSPGRLAEALSRVLASDWDHDHLRNRVIERFSMREAADRYHALCRSVLEADQPSIW